MKPVYKSRVYTDRPAYADFDPPHKFLAIQSIVGKRLIEHPNAICPPIPAALVRANLPDMCEERREAS